MGDLAIRACLFTGSLHRALNGVCEDAVFLSTIHTLEKECFKIGKPAELQIGHIGDAIVTQMQHL